MADTELKDKLKALKEKIECFEKGDLFALYEIKEEMEFVFKSIPEKVYTASGEKIKVIGEFLAVDVNVDDVSDYLEVGYGFVSQYLAWLDKKINQSAFYTSLGQIKLRVDSFIEKHVLKSNALLYPEDYFDNIVEDQDMLMKFCDELKEHMDESQITLIDLEFDSTNEENINKVFRAFHTAKSSSAFLGLKNIEEVAHKMEDMLALVRDRKMQITKELIDVIFYGINFFRELSGIIESEKYEKGKIIEGFREINIYTYIDLINEILQNYQAKKIGEILLEDGKLDKKLIDAILMKQENSAGKKFGEISVEENYISEEDLKDALKKQNMQSKPQTSVFVKVSNSKLNELIDLVGELVINQSMLRQSRDDDVGGCIGLDDTSSTQLEKITTSIKNIVLSMGMVPVSEVFNKLRVVVRNAANELNKIVNLEIAGESTELDRNVIETIYDPLVHIVRNAVDHGIESSEERITAGKNKIGRIKIEAIHKGNNIEIQIIDDGKGIDRERVVEKAIEKKLISADDAQKLDDKDIYNFMFLPGFSTAKKITEMSGRGVGLDVVKKNIEQIHGKVEIKSIKGKYTQFLIKLPLTLAIIDGFITVINGVKYIFPFSIIEEIIIPEGYQVSTMEDGQLMLYLRNNYIPIIFAGKTLGEETYNTNLGNILIIIINYQNRFYGIAVDSIAGKQEIVIKNLNQALSNLKIFSGGTIFGDGTIGFVIDVEEFMEKVREETKIPVN